MHASISTTRPTHLPVLSYGMFCLLAAAVLRLDNRPSLTANLGSVVTAMAIKLQDFWCHRLNKMQAGCVLVSQTEQNASRIVLGVTGETNCKQEDSSNSRVAYILKQQSTLTRLGSFFVESDTRWTRTFCTTVVAASAFLGSRRG